MGFKIFNRVKFIYMFVCILCNIIIAYAFIHIINILFVSLLLLAVNIFIDYVYLFVLKHVAKRSNKSLNIFNIKRVANSRIMVILLMIPLIYVTTQLVDTDNDIIGIWGIISYNIALLLIFINEVLVLIDTEKPVMETKIISIINWVFIFSWILLELYLYTMFI